MYECHLTYDGLNGTVEHDLMSMAATLGWSSSHIDGDPDFDPGKRLFLTCHSEDCQVMLQKMNAFVAVSAPVQPSRQKIAHIVFDTLIADLMFVG